MGASVSRQPPDRTHRTDMISRLIVGLALVYSCQAATTAPLLETALEVLGRATSSSEVLTLNLTNVLILLALKVAIIAFGLFSGAASARSSTDDTGLSQVDMTGAMCFLLYTSGDESKLDCLARSACESPISATNFNMAAKMWYKMHKLIQAVPFQDKYITIMDTISQAASAGQNGEQCDKYNW